MFLLLLFFAICDMILNAMSLAVVVVVVVVFFSSALQQEKKHHIS